MSTASTHDVTRLLQAWSRGATQASDQLLPLIYDQLRRIAREYMRRERPGHTLQPTALVHEAYLRLTRGEPIEWQGRAHFYNVAARAMRRILVNHARDRQRLKRQGVQVMVSLDDGAEVAQPGEEGGVDLIALDAALDRLTETYPRQSQVVELRFFADMESRDIAEVLQVSEKTVLRDWQFAKLWLHRELIQADE
jgi:RNA polymerase sigma factor (TIGR02999 family)